MKLARNGRAAATRAPGVPPLEFGGRARHLGRMNPPHLPMPLLADAELPAFPAITPDHVLPAIDSVARRLPGRGRSRWSPIRRARDFASPASRRWNDMEERLGRAFAPVSHLHGVKDSPELREAYSAALEKITDHGTELGQNRELYEAVRALRESAGVRRPGPRAADAGRRQPARFPPVRRGAGGAGANALPRHPEPAEQGRDRVRGSRARCHRRLDAAGLATPNSPGLPESARAMLAQAGARTTSTTAGWRR